MTSTDGLTWRDFVKEGEKRAALRWSAERLPVRRLRASGYAVFDWPELLARLAPSQNDDLRARTLASPSGPLRQFFEHTPRVAIARVIIDSPQTVHRLYSRVVLPAYQSGATLAIQCDSDIGDLTRTQSPEEGFAYAWSAERLEWLLGRYRLVCAHNDLPPLTPIEWRLHEAAAERGLPLIPQYGIGDVRVDFAVPDRSLAIECDGRDWHDPDRDARRDELLRSKGWSVLRFSGSRIVSDAGQVIAEIEASLVGNLPTANCTKARAAMALDHLMGPLDDGQRHAVFARGGVTQVIAPAGSGKTRVLVARVAKLVADGVHPSRILCLTFNRAAKDELAQRLEALTFDGVRAQTFHSVGREILAAEGALRGQAPISLTVAQWKALARTAKEDLDSAGQGVWLEPDEASSAVSDLKLGQMLTVDQALAQARLPESSPEQKSAARIYQLYEARLADLDTHDYDDMIIHAVRLLHRDRHARERWQQRWHAVLVDEYQDIEPAQELLVQTLAAPQDCLFCVGDEDQTLYAWRRASVDRMLLLDERYPTLERHALNTSYRCPPEVVKAATRLIGHNRRRFDKTIRPYDAHSRAGRQRSIRVEACGSLESQATAAVLALQKHDESDAVLLARSSRLLRIAAVECVKRGVAFWTPMKSVIGVGGAHAVLCSYLRALSNPRGVEAADVDLMCRAPNRYLPRGRAKQVAGRLHRGASFCEAFKDAGGMEQWRQRALDDAARLFDDLCLEPDAAVVIRRLRNDGGLDDYCSSRERLKKTEHVELEVLESAEREAGGLSVTELLDSWERLDQQLAQMNTKGGYELNTIHGAKGREWECVVILGCDEKQLPHHYALSPKLTKTRVLATGADDDIESERRLAYVALTRTTDELFLLHTTGAASRFLAEAGLLAPAPTSPPIGSTKTRGVPARHVPRMRYGSQKRGQRSSSQVKAWTSGQDAWLRSMHSAQMDQRTIAKKLDRPEQDVANRLRELGLN